MFTLHSEESVKIDRRDYALKMLQRLRDEAHRFAITYHRRAHEKTNLQSELKNIEGIGAKKRKALLDKFGSPENVRRATKEELMSVPGIGEKHAEAVLKYFSDKTQKGENQ